MLYEFTTFESNREKYSPFISSSPSLSNFAELLNRHHAAAYQPYWYWAESEKYLLDVVYVIYLEELMNTENYTARD